MRSCMDEHTFPSAWTAAGPPCTAAKAQHNAATPPAESCTDDNTPHRSCTVRDYLIPVVHVAARPVHDGQIPGRSMHGWKYYYIFIHDCRRKGITH